ncbi:hypothetical protein [Chryseobacterium shigense]|uniref:ABC-type branched-subunit amino acid transport system permease subunit n=1 Tax=Chryseobacterium shigense TaxID=297244 RepID=A0A841N787_9FLAO|nr:hypothetical protein [Chryseobacterium shigense]MBB6372437.1 ABC-type branched-subunit amino acid transport system permease subunit [Chryseobacterium shigense]
MKGILNLRKVILGYAGISFLLIIVDNLIHFRHNVRDFMAGFRDGSEFNAYHKTNPDTLTPELGNYIVFAVVVIITVYFIYLIYKKTYGRILSHLRKNYRELSRT